MSTPNAAPGVVALNQQQEQCIDKIERSDDNSATPCENKTENRTVVENGKVVVKPSKVESRKSKVES